jgi:hypothetical protein
MSQETTTEQAAVAEVEQNQFVSVPGKTLPGGQVVASFMVGKYLSAFDGAGKVIVTESAVPAASINYSAARMACEAAGFKMLTLSQSAALALDIAGVAENWTGGEVGQGDLMQGLHLGSVRGAVAGTYVPTNEIERRGFKLSNGEVIFDAAGHLYTWIFDDVQGDENGVVARAFAEDSPAVCASPFPSEEQGMGWYPDAGDDWSGYALVRGGYWGSVSFAGVFHLGNVSPVRGGDRVGFRCTK